MNVYMNVHINLHLNGTLDVHINIYINVLMNVHINVHIKCNINVHHLHIYMNIHYSKKTWQGWGVKSMLDLTFISLSRSNHFLFLAEIV